MLPVNVISRQILPGNMVEIIDVDIDIIAVVRVAAVMIIIVVVIVIVMMVIVIIPVDAAEQGVGGGDAEAIAKPLTKLLVNCSPGGGQVDRRVGRVRPGAVNNRRVIGRHVHHVRIGGFDFNHLGGAEDVTALLLREVLVVDVAGAAAFVAVMTFCCGVDFSVPVCWAMARKRCTESMTSCGWARNALPRFSTHGAFSPINASRKGRRPAILRWDPRAGLPPLVPPHPLHCRIILRPLHRLNDVTRIGRSHQHL